MRVVHFQKQFHKLNQHRGHAHFWQRALLSRRNFLRTTAGVAGASLLVAKVDGAAPKPIPGGFQITPGGPFFHVSGGPGGENSTITDFNGFIGSAIVDGTGTGKNLSTGAQSQLNFDTDMRFMQGEYIGIDGKHYQGTFAFV
jgi:TAT (twin-arginine translocation) pathway signal sequence